MIYISFVHFEMEWRLKTRTHTAIHSCCASVSMCVFSTCFFCSSSLLFYWCQVDSLFVAWNRHTNRGTLVHGFNVARNTIWNIFKTTSKYTQMHINSPAGKNKLIAFLLSTHAEKWNSMAKLAHYICLCRRRCRRRRSGLWEWLLNWRLTWQPTGQSAH